MKFFLVLTCAVFIGLANAAGKKWALLIAGSAGWENYGDQADVSHSYHTVSRHGIPDENIIVMIYDDVAWDSQNPKPGTLINRIDGPDVYKGVPKDYTKDTVTPQNFLNVLSGNAPALSGIGTGRVIASDGDDDIFVYFNDHGGTGLLAFPNDVLTVDALTTTLKQMHSQNKYKRLVFYVDACNSGSMFDGVLPKDSQIYATTSANPDESAYFCQMDPTLNTFVNSDYSYNWKVDADIQDTTTETLLQEYNIVTKQTTNSHVMQYGTLGLNMLPLADFFGDQEPTPPTYPPKVPCVSPTLNEYSSSKNDAALFLLHSRLRRTNSLVEQNKIKNKIATMKAKRSYLDSVVNEIVTRVAKTPAEARQIRQTKSGVVRQLKCHDLLVKTFHNYCFNLGENTYGLQFVTYLNNMCTLNVRDAVETATIIRETCQELHQEGTH